MEGPRLEHNKDIEDKLDEYMIMGMPDVIGWFEMQALLVIRVISSHQIENEIKGGVAEIGVHHGKFFAALCLLNMDAGIYSGAAIAIDVFEVESMKVWPCYYIEIWNLVHSIFQPTDFAPRINISMWMRREKETEIFSMLQYTDGADLNPSLQTDYRSCKEIPKQ
jgi:hypothetical protein